MLTTCLSLVWRGYARSNRFVHSAAPPPGRSSSEARAECSYSDLKTYSIYLVTKAMREKKRVFYFTWRVFHCLPRFPHSVAIEYPPLCIWGKSPRADPHPWAAQSTEEPSALALAEPLSKFVPKLLHDVCSHQTASRPRSWPWRTPARSPAHRIRLGNSTVDVFGTVIFL